MGGKVGLYGRERGGPGHPSPSEKNPKGRRGVDPPTPPPPKGLFTHKPGDMMWLRGIPREWMLWREMPGHELPLGELPLHPRHIPLVDEGLLRFRAPLQDGGHGTRKQFGTWCRRSENWRSFQKQHHLIRVCEWRSIENFEPTCGAKTDPHPPP